MTDDPVQWADLLGKLRTDPTDQAAWDELCRRTANYARQILDRHPGLGDESADDLSQQMLLKLLESMHGVGHLDEERSPSAYLRTAVKNAATDMLRRRLLAVRTLQALADKRARQDARDISLVGRRQWVRSLLLSLDERDEQLIRMRFWESRDLTDIADQLGQKRSTVAVRIFRILAELRQRAQSIGRDDLP